MIESESHFRVGALSAIRHQTKDQRFLPARRAKQLTTLFGLVHGSCAEAGLMEHRMSKLGFSLSSIIFVITNRIKKEEGTCFQCIICRLDGKNAFVMVERDVTEQKDCQIGSDQSEWPIGISPIQSHATSAPLTTVAVYSTAPLRLWVGYPLALLLFLLLLLQINDSHCFSLSAFLTNSTSFIDHPSPAHSRQQSSRCSAGPAAKIATTMKPHAPPTCPTSKWVSLHRTQLSRRTDCSLHESRRLFDPSTQR